MIDEHVIALANGDTYGVALQATGGIHLGRAPMGHSLPAVVVQKISTFDREMTHSGAAAHARSRFQFTALAHTAFAAKTLAAAIVALFHGYSGAVGGSNVFYAKQVNEIDQFDEDLGTFAVLVDIEFAHNAG